MTLANTERYAKNMLNGAAPRMAKRAMTKENQIVLFWKFFVPKTKKFSVLNSFMSLSLDSKVGFTWDALFW